jgi:hypothetical protein
MLLCTDEVSHQVIEIKSISSLAQQEASLVSFKLQVGVPQSMTMLRPWMRIFQSLARLLGQMRRLQRSRAPHVWQICLQSTKQAYSLRKPWLKRSSQQQQDCFNSDCHLP